VLLANAFEGKDGIIGIGHQVLGGLEQTVSHHIFGVELEEGQELVSTWVWNAILRMPGTQAYAHDYISEYNGTEKDRKEGTIIGLKSITINSRHS